MINELEFQLVNRFFNVMPILRKAPLLSAAIFFLLLCIVLGRILAFTQIMPDYSDSIGEELNKDKTGSAVSWNVWRQDEWYLFVRDFKKSRTKPIFLCYMNYTSTQGSYDAKWSKDKQMVAVYDESSKMFPEDHSPEWIIGYDWKRGKVLHSKEIVRAFALHGGVGRSCRFQNSRTPNAQELKQFEPEKLNRQRHMP